MEEFDSDEFEKKAQEVEAKNIEFEAKKEPKFVEVLNESEQHIKNLEKKLEKVKKKPVQYNTDNIDELDDTNSEDAIEQPFIKDEIKEDEELNPKLEVEKGFAKKVYDKEEELNIDNHHLAKTEEFSFYKIFSCCFKPHEDEETSEKEDYENFN